jgi:hypothetical protein
MNRRSFLATITAGAAMAGTTAASVAPLIAEPATDEIGRLVTEAAGAPEPMDRVRAAVAELRAAVVALDPTLEEWSVFGTYAVPLAGERPLCRNFAIVARPKVPPPRFEGPGVYEIEIRRRGRTIRPVWWVEESPRKVGFFRARFVWQQKPIGRWRRLAFDEVRFIRRIRDAD